MAYSDRKALYSQIESIRNRPLIVFVTSLRPNAAGAIAPDLISEFLKQLLVISQEHAEIDLLLVSNGGDPIVPWRIVNILRERFSKLGVLLPYVAYSAATLLSLGADEIVMHPYSNLGPVDPQLTSQRRVPNPTGSGEILETIQFASEDARNFLEFVREDVGISDQEQLEKAFELLCKDVGSIPLGVAKRSSGLSLSLGEQLLSLHMKDSSQAKAIAEALNRSFYSHSFTLGRKQAQKIGLPVIAPEQPLESLMWQVWTDLEEEMQCNKPFNPLEEVLKNTQAGQLLQSVQQIQIPANLPPQLMQAAFQQVLQQIQVIAAPSVDFELFIATVESTNLRSEFRTRGKITAVRLPDMNISLNTMKTFEGWTTIRP